MLIKYINAEYRNKLRYIRDFYSEEHQKIKLIEELDEVHEHLKKVINNKNILSMIEVSKMQEEIIDVLIVAAQLKRLKQVYLYFKPQIFPSFWSEYYYKFFKYKVDRQIDRIKKEKNNLTN